MNRLRLIVFVLIVFSAALAACDQTVPAPNPTDNSGSGQVPGALQTAGANETPFTAQTAPTVPTASEAYCKNGGAVTVQPNEPLAAKVNGQPIPLSLYNRQDAQAQDAFTAQGGDPNSADGKEQIKGLKEQTLGLLIDNMLVEQAAQAENVTVSAQDVNNRLQQMIDEAKGRDAFNQFLTNTNQTMEDVCMDMRSSILGEIMLSRVTAALPVKVEQLHMAQILLATRPDADKALAQLKAGVDFGALAKQISKDEVSRDNGGDMGWIPRGVMPQEWEAAAFALQAGQLSGVVQTQIGFHILKELERDPSHELAPDMLQAQKQAAFDAWLTAQRQKAKIEKLANP